ncbi:hypothetical protein PFICI_02690 [Pestalotiopsis fici W106-1]|uniref:UBR-type domain-containing protein n=1 Tax=Pestalotiopsis fici (strain W106-1 / CGMCC3.15140) TaxID=1229662 RepID=W3XF47_PESFW|nr:uncharacterized protein PFICI_02690 [Pestalotiopsis fici W106-1]ETS84665.1 hypothetical protein PFICI_02690 [Pestalotiopsis fici W106-1]
MSDESQPPIAAPDESVVDAASHEAPSRRRESMSQRSEDSQTAADFLRDQMQLEADAREALPYSIDNCTKQLGPLRQNVFACLTCHPPPAELGADSDYEPAGVCYSCSIQCHGEHELVEIFQKRNFTCDCGTTRFSAEHPCTLRMNSETNTKGGVHSEPADPNNKYNQNFRNRFCSCAIDYNPHEQKGTMFQCLGLGTHEEGGCGEDWYHPGCLMGLGPKWYEASKPTSTKIISDSNLLPTISEDTPPQSNTPQQTGDTAAAEEGEDDDEAPLPDGFPGEDDFEHFICYKCVDANPWIKQYAGTAGFLPALNFNSPGELASSSAKKRQRDDQADGDDLQNENKRIKSEESTGLSGGSSAMQNDEAKSSAQEASKEEPKDAVTGSDASCKCDSLPQAAPGQFSLFVTENFRNHFCRCAKCFPILQKHPQLLEEEESYEPPLTDAASEHGSTQGSGSIYERGESALRNVDRVRAIEGVMAYNHMKEKLKPFFEKFAGSGKAISAEDIKEYFAKLRGDEDAIQEAGEAAKSDHRQEQSGY